MATPLDTVIDDIYQAAFDAASFKTMFQRICTILDAPQGCIMVLGADSAISYIHNINPDSQQNYNTAYLGEDPWYQQAVARRLQRVVVTGQELLPTREFRHTGFYQDVMACSDIYDCLSITLEDNGADNAGLILYRTRKQALFNKQDKAVFTTLVPHLRRMIRMRRLLEEQHFMQGMNTQALDCLAIGIVLLDHSGIVRYANRSAEAILSSGDGLAVRHGRLVAAHGDNERLERMIAGALANTPGSTASGGELCIHRSSGTLPYALQILPVTPGASEHFVLTPRSSAHGAIVIITDPAQSIEPSPRTLKDLFNLTPTEAAIAAELAAGNSIREIANARGVSERTVRWHVSNVQDKLGVRRLVDLVRLVASSNGPGRRTERTPVPRKTR